MKIRHERPMSELSFQVRAPLGLELTSGEQLTIHHWSLKEFAFPGEADVLPSKATLSIPFQGVDIRFPVRLTPGSEPGMLAFSGLTGRQRETLAVFYRSILSGKMASTEDVITSLDTPVDLVAMEETEEERAEGEAKVPSRSLRIMRNVIVYLLAALLIFGTLGGSIWDRLTTVPIQHARIVAPVLVHRAPEAGFVEEILVTPGQEVRQGETLIRLSNPERETALDEVRGRIARLDARAAETANRIVVVDRQLRRARHPLEEALARAVAARRISDFFGGYEMDQIVAALAALSLFDDGLSAEAAPIFDARRALRREAQVLEDDLRLLRRERGTLRDGAEALHIIASADGIVTELAVFPDQYIPRGHEAAQIEEAHPRAVRGWIDPDMAQAVYPGMAVRARVNLNGQSASYAGRITQMEAGIDPDLPGAFGTILTIAFDGMSAAETRATFPPGAPVELRALRDLGRLSVLGDRQ